MKLFYELLSLAAVVIGMYLLWIGQSQIGAIGLMLLGIWFQAGVFNINLEEIRDAQGSENDPTPHP